MRAIAWLKAYAARVGAVYADYYFVSNDGAGGMPPSLCPDGVHPNAAGHAVMRPAAGPAVLAALSGPAAKPVR